MNTLEVIVRKRDGAALAEAEIQFLVDGLVCGTVPDYQMAAFCMAVYYRGMNAAETAALTRAMTESGEQLLLGEAFPHLIEQHSTGCVGDYGDLTLLPLLAALGLRIAKVTGPGLAQVTGITDTFEATGARTTLTRAEMVQALETCGLVLACHSRTFVPADRALYAICSATGTVPSVPLMVASIMSKKLATGAPTIQVDVKYGDGAFLQEERDALALAELMADIGARLGRTVGVPIYRVRQPLGRCIGSVHELRQAVEVLRGGGPADLVGHVLTLGAEVLQLTGRTDNADEARRQLQATLASGAALETFRAWVAGQGGDAAFIEAPEQLGRAPVVREVPAPRDGWVAALSGNAVGFAAVHLGAGRARREDPIDHRAGVVLHRRVGERTERGGPLFTVHGTDEERVDAAAARILSAYRWSARPVPAASPASGPVFYRGPG